MFGVLFTFEFTNRQTAFWLLCFVYLLFCFVLGVGEGMSSYYVALAGLELVL